MSQERLHLHSCLRKQRLCLPARTILTHFPEQRTALVLQIHCPEQVSLETDLTHLVLGRPECSIHLDKKNAGHGLLDTNLSPGIIRSAHSTLKVCWVNMTLACLSGVDLRIEGRGWRMQLTDTFFQSFLYYLMVRTIHSLLCMHILALSIYSYTH